MASSDEVPIPVIVGIFGCGCLFIIVAVFVFTGLGAILWATAAKLLSGG